MPKDTALSIDKDCKLLPNEADHHCFACSATNPYGLQMRFFAKNDTVISQVSVPDHLCGWTNVVHGGVVSALLDEIMSWSAMYLFKKFILTKSMRVDFNKPVIVGREVTVIGSAQGPPRKREVMMQGVLYDTDGKECATATGCLVLLNAAIATRLGIVDKDAVKDFDPLFQA